MRKRTFIVSLVLGVACCAAVLASLAGAKAPVVQFGITFVPDPVVTAGGQSLVIASFANNGGNALNQVKFNIMLPSGSTFVLAGSSSGCSSSGTTVTCLVGHVEASSTAKRYVVFNAPLSPPGLLSVSGFANWDEALGNKTHSDHTATATDSSTLVATTNVNALGRCSNSADSVSTAAATSSAGNRVNTSVSFSANNQGLPCTPVSLQDDVAITLTNFTCTASPCVGSELTLPQLPDRAAVTITLDGSLFSSPGPGPRPDTFVLYEITSGTIGEAVPRCSTGINTLFGSCEVGAVKFGTRGIQVNLLVPGSGIDPKFGG